jgi:hypothetical protein
VGINHRQALRFQAPADFVKRIPIPEYVRQRVIAQDQIETSCTKAHARHIHLHESMRTRHALMKGQYSDIDYGAPVPADYPRI